MSFGNTWVVIPAHKPRLGDLKSCLKYLRHDPRYTVVVWNGDYSPPEVDGHVVVDYEGRDVNISRWWNLGLDYISFRENKSHQVLILNCDARITNFGVERLSEQLRRWDLAMVGPSHSGDYQGSEIYVNRDLKPITMWDRVAGYCFMLAGELGIRADERLRWWFTDDHIEWQARKLKGTGLVPGVTVQHPTWGGTQICGSFVDVVKEDQRIFEEIWGTPPILELL